MVIKLSTLVNGVCESASMCQCVLFAALGGARGLICSRNIDRKRPCNEVFLLRDPSYHHAAVQTRKQTYRNKKLGFIAILWTPCTNGIKSLTLTLILLPHCVPHLPIDQQPRSWMVLTFQGGSYCSPFVYFISPL